MEVQEYHKDFMGNSKYIFVSEAIIPNEFENSKFYENLKCREYKLPHDKDLCHYIFDGDDDDDGWKLESYEHEDQNIFCTS